MIILTSKRSGHSCVNHMIQSEIETCNKYLVAMVKPNPEWDISSLLEMTAHPHTGDLGGQLRIRCGQL